MKFTVSGDGTITGTRVVDESGNDISKSVSAVRFSHQAGGVPIVEIDVIPREIGFPGEGKVYIGGRQVSRIIYADGGEEEF